jgi:endonuclease III-like uncharacterized protein
MIIEEVIKLLEQEYGLLEWRPGKDSIAVLIGTILSQNTSDVNSIRLRRSRALSALIFLNR